MLPSCMLPQQHRTAATVMQQQQQQEEDPADVYERQENQHL